MRIVVTGLGKMGSQIVRKLTEDGHDVIAYDIDRVSTEKAARFGATGAYERVDAPNYFTNEPVVLWMMLPAGVIDDELNEWLPLLPAGSVIVDGGNSDFRRTRERASRVADKGSALVDVGTSGGVWGHQNGFSLMVGGDEDAYKVLEPALKTLAKPSGAYRYLGPSGSGHFVKMVHNAIEYGMMESLAEGYHMLKEGPYKELDLAAVGEVWQHGSVVQSWLNELSRQALADNPTLEGIEGYVAETGEVRWTLEAAKDLGIPLPVVQTAFEVREASRNGQTNFATKLLAALRNKFGGHKLNKEG